MAKKVGDIVKGILEEVRGKMLENQYQIESEDSFAMVIIEEERRTENGADYAEITDIELQTDVENPELSALLAIENELSKEDK